LNKSAKSLLIRNKPSFHRSNLREREIARENQCLVKKIVALDNNNTSKYFKTPFRRHMSNLQNKAAKWEQERIAQENIRILQNILNPVGSVSKKKHDNDYITNLSYKESLQRLRGTSYESFLHTFLRESYGVSYEFT